MVENKNVVLLKLVPFCDYRCRICLCAGCTSPTLIGPEELTERVQNAVLNGVTVFLVPANVAFYPEKSLLMDLANKNGFVVRLFSSVENLEAEEMSVFEAHLEAGGEVDFFIESQIEAGLAAHLVELARTHGLRLRVTFLISRDRGTSQAFATIPGALHEHLRFFSPFKQSREDNFATSDELFEFVETVQALAPDLEICSNHDFESAVQSARAALRSSAPPLNGRQRRRQRRLQLQNEYRQNLRRSFYLENLHAMGEFPLLRQFLDRLFSFRFLRWLIAPLYFFTWRLQRKVFATAVERGVLQQSRVFTEISRTFGLFRNQLWKMKIPYYKGIWLSGMIRVAMIRLKFFILRQIGTVRIAMIRFGFLIRHAAVVSWAYLSGEMRWFWKSPNGWMLAHAPRLQFLFFQPFIKAYFFTDYQFRTRLNLRKMIAKIKSRGQSETAPEWTSGLAIADNQMAKPEFSRNPAEK